MKTIMIRDEVYMKLAKLKGGMSFSQLLDSFAEERKMGKLAVLEKIRGILTDEDAKEANRRIKQMREHFKMGSA